MSGVLALLSTHNDWGIFSSLYDFKNQLYCPFYLSRSSFGSIALAMIDFLLF